MLANPIHLEIKKASKESTPILISAVAIATESWQLHTNYFAILWIHQGNGTVEIDLMKKHFKAKKATIK